MTYSSQKSILGYLFESAQVNIDNVMSYCVLSIVLTRWNGRGQRMNSPAVTAFILGALAEEVVQLAKIAAQK